MNQSYDCLCSQSHKYLISLCDRAALLSKNTLMSHTVALADKLLHYSKQVAETRTLSCFCKYQIPNVC